MNGDPPRRGLWHRWLLAIPFIWQVGFIPFVNDITLRPFLLPFPMFWQMAGILVTSLVLGTVFMIDRSREPDDAIDPPQRGDHS